MKFVIWFTTALLVSCRASRIMKNSIFLNEIDNEIEKDALSSSKHIRNFAVITSRPEEIVHYKPGAATFLVCEGMGSPAPKIRWFKNNVPIYEHNMGSNKITKSSSTSVARITSTLLVTRAKNMDEFTCVVSAKTKTARATSTVYTDDTATEHEDQRKLVLREPHILTSYVTFIDTVGSRVELPCKTRGLPRPRVIWRNSKGHIIKNDGRIQVLRSGKLVILSLKWSDMDEYMCEATNAFGTQRAATFVYPAKAE